MIFIITLKNTTKLRNVIVFDDMIADKPSTKNKLNLKVTELFIKGRKLSIFFVIITQSYFTVPKNITLNSSQFFIIKTPNKLELHQIAFNHSSDIDSQKFMNLYKMCTENYIIFFIFDITLALDNSSRFGKNI